MAPIPPKNRAVMALALLAALVVPTGAASVRRLELDELRSKASSVFSGEVIGTSMRLGSDGQMVWTDYEISVEESLAGPDPGKRTTVSFAGGTVPELSIGIPGVPDLREGHHYVFFIEPKRDSRHAFLPMPTVGWGQGLFRIVRVDESGGSRTVLVSADGEPLEISSDGRLMRGAPVRVADGRVVDAESAIRDGAGVRVRPSYFEAASGEVRPVSPAPQPAAISVRTARTFATFDDLRSYVQGRMESRPIRNR